MHPHTFPFTITQADKDRLEPALPRGLFEAYEQAYRLAERQSDKAVRKLRKLVAEHPRTPHFKLLLANYYDDAGNPDAALLLCHEVLAEFPNCLETRVDLARHALMEANLEAARTLLGDELELTVLYPQQTSFHEADVANYYGVVAAFLTAHNKADEGQQLLQRLKDAFPDLEEVAQAEDFVSQLNLETARRNMAFFSDDVRVVAGGLRPAVESYEEPSFTHKEVEQLYHHDFNIPGTLLDELLALPTDTLAADLHLVIADSRQRLYQFEEIQEEYGQPADFLTHAIMLLAEKEHSASLPQIFEALRNGEDFIEFYFGDLSTEGLWNAFYRLGRRDVAPLFDFLKEGGVTSFAKIPVLQAVEQLYLQEPTLQAVIREGAADLVRHYVAHAADPALADSYVAADLCQLLRLCDAPDAQELVHQLYATGMIAASFQGTEAEYLASELVAYPKAVKGIHEFYHHIATSWSGYQDREHGWEEPLDDAYLELPATTAKVGRNDPCPCGSGKKYKKCCGKEA